MLLRKWEDLPDDIRTETVRPYYEVLNKKRFGLFVKRLFDIIASLGLMVVLSPIFLILAVAICMDSRGPIIFKQIRITQYSREFKIYKFRTMVLQAEKLGSQVTTKGDNRITKIGRFLRKCRLDELPQLLNIIKGDMSFVGTRPEVPAYVHCYTSEMFATLLLPAGVTSTASIEYKDEDALLTNAEDANKTYIETVLPAKMKYNLDYLMDYSFLKDILIMLKTVKAILNIIKIINPLKN